MFENCRVLVHQCCYDGSAECHLVIGNGRLCHQHMTSEHCLITLVMYDLLPKLPPSDYGISYIQHLTTYHNQAAFYRVPPGV